VPTKKDKQPLSVTHPELAKEADGWDPNDFTKGSHRKVKWKCKSGHTWEAAVKTRALSGNSCPVCSGHVVVAGFNDLESKYPTIAKEAYGWDPSTVTPMSGKKVFWRCEKEHITEKRIADKVSGVGCPICSGHQVLIGFNDLATTHPELIKEADGWNPATITKGHDKKLNWKCHLGHQWKASAYTRTGKEKTGCPFCAEKRVLTGFNDLQNRYPEIAKEAVGWDPATVHPGSNKALTWKCGLGHLWKSSPDQRIRRGTNCLVCSNHVLLIGFNDLATTHPHLVLEIAGWDPTKYGRGSRYRAEWICAVGHHYTAPISQRTFNETGCPVCSGRSVLPGFNDLATTHPEIARQAVGWDPQTVNAGSNKKLRWHCEEGHEWITQPNDRVGGGKGCPTCAKAGFDPNKDGWLYFLQHPTWELFQIGITNNPDKRVGTHIKSGWDVIEIRGAMDGHITQQWETDILRMLRKAGAKLSPESAGGKFDGYSEAWTKDSFSAKSIYELMEIVKDSE